ncbi:MAG: ribonuclease J, partial [Alphaproteobacteria bacterium]
YGYAGKWLMVDLGVTFGNDETPGVDVIMPDIAFIEERRDVLAGLVLTHAHEDHIGAVQYLWPRLRCPVYATPFTAALLRRKLADTGLADLPITVIPMEGRFRVGPFDLELITLTHSIPEPNAVVIRTGQGTILHTGDWKLDPDPLVGPVADEAALKAIGEEGVLALVGDSTNAMREGEAGSEGEVRGALLSLVQKCRNRVAVACFASNVARLQTLVDVAEATDRHIALVGRSLWRIVGAARETDISTATSPSSTTARRHGCRATACCSSAPAARASRARHCRASPAGSTRRSCWRRGTPASSRRGSSPATSGRSPACTTICCAAASRC